MSAAAPGGTGIGTLTSAILAAGPPTTEVVSAEDNDYCRDQLATLLGA